MPGGKIPLNVASGTHRGLPSISIVHWGVDLPTDFVARFGDPRIRRFKAGSGEPGFPLYEEFVAEPDLTLVVHRNEDGSIQQIRVSGERSDWQEASPLAAEAMEALVDELVQPSARDVKAKSNFAFGGISGTTTIYEGLWIRRIFAMKVMVSVQIGFIATSKAVPIEDPP